MALAIAHTQRNPGGVNVLQLIVSIRQPALVEFISSNPASDTLIGVASSPRQKEKQQSKTTHKHGRPHHSPPQVQGRSGHCRARLVRSSKVRREDDPLDQ